MNSIKKRKAYLDTLKFISLFLIFVGHFIGSFNADYKIFWEIAPTKYLLSALRAKTGVCFFSVILGYLSFKKRDESLLKYSIRRYCYFFFVGLFINLIYVFYKDWSVFAAINAALHISKEVYPHFWCMRYFLVASIVSYFLAKKDASAVEKLFFIILLYYAELEWSAICLFGSLINDIKKLKIFKNNIAKIVLFIIAFSLVQGPETERSFIFYGIYAVVIICIIENSPKLEKIFSGKLFSYFGTKTMAMLVIHSVIYNIVGKFLFSNYFSVNDIGFLWCLLLTFAIVCIVSIPITFMFDQLNRFVNYTLTKIEHFIIERHNTKSPE